jgi:hypothetical protein
MSKDAFCFLNQIETNIFLNSFDQILIFSTFWYDCANASESTGSEVIEANTRPPLLSTFPLSTLVPA